MIDLALVLGSLLKIMSFKPAGTPAKTPAATPAPVAKKLAKNTPSAKSPSVNAKAGKPGGGSGVKQVISSFRYYQNS